MTQGQIAEVRRFHRLVTQRAGALDDHFLGRARPLGESCVLFEIGGDSRSGAELRDLRARLGLDSGYLSRVVQSLESAGLIKVQNEPDDERVRRAHLTAKGRAEIAEMDRRSDDVAKHILEPLSTAHRERLVAAMSEVRRLLRASGVSIERVDPASAPARWCMSRYYTELARRFAEGFDPSQSIPADDAELRPPHGAFLLATVDGEAVACGAVKVIAPKVGSLKRMWVADSVRGLGVGRRMLAALETEARELGIKTLRLETNRALLEALHLYRSAGYSEVAQFNDDPYANHWFEKTLGARRARR